jgi:hypothetical protein
MFSIMEALAASGTPSKGFVVAMRARTLELCRPCRYEWIIVARWGEHGEYVALSWTDYHADGTEAPIQLQPRRTVIGVQREDARPSGCVGFELAARLPEAVMVASGFIASTGTIRLCFSDGVLRLRCKGSSVAPDAPGAWDLYAHRGPWIGEFIDPRAG